jgi:xanthine dehydrogenase accessory factor
MCVNERGEFAGSVSGGCVETAVAEEALGVLKDGTPRLLAYGVTNEDAWEVGLACGGSVEVFVERLADADLLDALTPPHDRGAPRVVATHLAGGGRAILRMGTAHDGTVTVTTVDGVITDELAESGALLEAARSAVEADRSHAVEVDGHRVFLDAVTPPVRVLVVGAVHIAQALVAMIRAAGFEVIVVDPRTAFASTDRFPGVELVHAWPGEAFERLGLDRRTAVVALTHDPKLDDPALVAAVASDAFYVGALGSSRTHARRVERLRDEGVSAERVGRIHAPIGLDIGARTPGEIAAAVVAEIVQALRGAG